MFSSFGFLFSNIQSVIGVPLVLTFKCFYCYFLYIFMLINLLVKLRIILVLFGCCVWFCISAYFYGWVRRQCWAACATPTHQRTPCRIFNGWPVHSVAGNFTLNRKKLPIGWLIHQRHPVAYSVVKFISKFLYYSCFILGMIYFLSFGFICCEVDAFRPLICLI